MSGLTTPLEGSVSLSNLELNGCNVYFSLEEHIDAFPHYYIPYPTGIKGVCCVFRAHFRRSCNVCASPTVSI